LTIAVCPAFGKLQDETFSGLYRSTNLVAAAPLALLPHAESTMQLNLPLIIVPSLLIAFEELSDFLCNIYYQHDHQRKNYTKPEANQHPSAKPYNINMDE
jgi:hypothetical protein